MASLFTPERHFAESQKEIAPFWAWYICRGETTDLPQIPFHALVTTDGEEFVLTEIHFRMRDEAALRKRLTALRSYQYDKKNDSWTWLKAKREKERPKLEALINDFERLQNVRTTEMPKFEIEKLRRLLGLPTKTN